MSWIVWIGAYLGVGATVSLAVAILAGDKLTSMAVREQISTVAFLALIWPAIVLVWLLT